ncbi:hypothetical protein [Glacieibacterium sp.]|uniref:hypothetical protein n=1 Tax=Glacieibacterium sp. TaxID=2860237 RepID=UPI003AFF6961
MIARFGSLLSGGAALAMVLGCYTVSLKVSGERKAVEDLRVKIASDMRGIRTLQAELKTRSRMPELQRWNDEVLAMNAPAAAQFVRDPVQLASFVATRGPQAPIVTVASAQAAPVQAPAAPAMRFTIAEAPAAPRSPLQRASYVVPSPSVADLAPVRAAPIARSSMPVQTAAAARPVASASQSVAVPKTNINNRTAEMGLGLDDAVTGAIAAAAASERASLKRVSLR